MVQPRGRRRGSNRGSGGGGSAQKDPSGTGSAPPTMGVLRSGVWHCNCSPPLPAVQLTVQRQTPNRGRQFYRCQKNGDKANKCGFFLWSEDAREREINAVMTNSRSEGGAGVGAGANAAATTPSKPLRQTTLHTSITPRADKHGAQNGPTPVSRLADIDFGGGTAAAAESPSKSASSATATSSTVRPSGGSDTKQSAAEPGKQGLDDLFTDSEDDEPVHAANVTGRPQPTAPAFSTTPTTTNPAAATTAAASAKRKRPTFEDEDEDRYGDLSSGEEQQLMTIAENSAKKQERERGRKPARSALVTPTVAAGRAHDADTAAAGMPTPLTERPVRRVLFADQVGGEVSGAKRQRLDEAGRSTTTPPQHQQQPTPTTAAAPALPTSSSPPARSPTTPSTSTSTRTATAATTPSTISGGGGDQGDITREVLSLLRGPGVAVPEAALRGVRAALERHAARARGLERGRDASRAAHAGAKRRVAELQARVADLENSRRLDATTATAAAAAARGGGGGGERGGGAGERWGRWEETWVVSL